MSLFNTAGSQAVTIPGGGNIYLVNGAASETLAVGAVASFYWSGSAWVRD
jgi:hypothetical protein